MTDFDEWLESLDPSKPCPSCHMPTVYLREYFRQLRNGEDMPAEIITMVIAVGIAAMSCAQVDLCKMKAVLSEDLHAGNAKPETIDGVEGVMFDLPVHELTAALVAFEDEAVTKGFIDAIHKMRVMIENLKKHDRRADTSTN